MDVHYKLHNDSEYRDRMQQVRVTGADVTFRLCEADGTNGHQNQFFCANYRQKAPYSLRKT